MPQVFIDGQPYEFEEGGKLLQFCLDQGIEIPHFCYHPALSVPANCRQCQVKAGLPARDRATGELVTDENGLPVINYFPKPQTSCSLDLADGMVVHTQYDSEEVAAIQADNLEMMLINHPLDCPICDQAGQCPLQNQAYKYGPEGSRFEFEKVHKPKRVQLGPNVVLDAERCINCTRCTRFTTEVTESHQLSIVNRGDKNYPMTAPGEVLDDPYSMNVTDICPVGALTEDYFRFKARVWEMSKTSSISDFGAKGINVDYWVRDNQILRITPRANLDVNEYWMPDVARLVYERYNENRLQGARVNGAAVAWETAYDEAAQILKDADGSVLFLGSAWATVEDNYLLTKLANAVGGEVLGYIGYHDEGSGDGWLISDDRAPNAQGCERLGLHAVDASLLQSKLSGASVLYILDDDPVAAGVLSAADLDGLTVILHVSHTTNETLPHAAVAFPAAMCVETIGTYVNEAGRAQRLRPAKMIRSMNRSLMMAMGTGQSRIDRGGTPFDRWHDETNRVDCLPGWTVIPELADRLGRPMHYKGPERVMDELAEQHSAFSGATYPAMDLLGVALEDIGEPA